MACFRGSTWAGRKEGQTHLESMRPVSLAPCANLTAICIIAPNRGFRSDTYLPRYLGPCPPTCNHPGSEQRYRVLSNPPRNSGKQTRSLSFAPSSSASSESAIGHRPSHWHTPTRFAFPQLQTFLNQVALTLSVFSTSSSPLAPILNRGFALASNNIISRSNSFPSYVT